jgi:hypothetical protein
MKRENAPSLAAANLPDCAEAMRSVSRLAAASQSTLNELTIDPGEFDRATAEIAAAAAALWRSEPTSDDTRTVATASVVSLRRWPVWALIAALWTSIAEVLAGAIGALMYLCR